MVIAVSMWSYLVVFCYGAVKVGVSIVGVWVSLPLSLRVWLLLIWVFVIVGLVSSFV